MLRPPAAMLQPSLTRSTLDLYLLQVKEDRRKRKALDGQVPAREHGRYALDMPRGQDDMLWICLCMHGSSEDMYMSSACHQHGHL